MTKLKKAPYFDKQAAQTTPFHDWLVLVGEKAHFAYYDKKEAGKGTEWAFIRYAYKFPLDRHPVILDGKNFDEIDRLLLAPNEQTSIKFFQVGNIPTLAKDRGDLDREDLKVRIMMNLAKNNTKAVAVEWLDSALQGENLADEIAQIRQGSHAVAEILSQTAPEIAIESDRPKETDKRSPFIEKRRMNGIDGLYRIIPKYSAEMQEWIESDLQWLADYVEVVGIGRSENEDYIVLQWQPENSKQKVIEALPLKDLGEREGWKLLKTRGLNVTTKNGLRNELADYIQTANKGNRPLWTITNATGWQNGAYILPNGEIIGEPEKPVMFRSQSASFAGYDTQGTLESWQNEIARYVNRNPSMMLGVAVALSAPLIHLLETESFGVHLFGGSTAGKTTTANIASSIYGHPDKTRLSWNATSLGLTNEAAARNDCFMPLDEIGQGSNKKHVEQTAYALFNGVGKIQGAREGGNRELQRWRIMAFSTGEIDLEGYLSANGMKTNAGQLVRLLNVPISQAKHYHDLPDGKAHADHLNQASKKHYGIVGRKWIEWLLAEKADIPTAYQAIKTKWLDRLPSDASPQVQRVASRFAILETALQLARPLTLWEEQTNAEALLHCFNEWVNIFGMHSREEKQVIEQVNGWLLANAEGRFIRYPIDERQPTIQNVAGYRMTLTDRNDKEYFYLYPLAFDEAIKGNPKEQACNILSDKGMLKKGNEQGYKFMTKLPHKVDPKRTRCYLLMPITEPETDSEELDQTG